MTPLLRAYLTTAALMLLGWLALNVYGFEARFAISTPLIVAASIAGVCVAGKRAVVDMQEQGRKQ